MITLRSEVCVITGAASGIGRAMADTFAAEGMRLVLADVDEGRLHAAADELTAQGHDCLAEVVDVSDPAAVDRLADATLDHFGSVRVVCNNAGVSTMGRQWELSVEDWEWVLGVCLWGVINGVRSFVPRLLEQGGPGHVVNTASMGGLLTAPFIGPYAAAKHGVVGLSKGLRAELGGTGIGVSVVCPGMVRTSILDSMRAHLATTGTGDGAEIGVMLDVLETGLQDGMSAHAAAAMVVDAVKADRFWVLPNGAEHLPSVQADFDELLGGARPTPETPA
jgi:NAD(P)-dependent dehydrogenase (short-subunit alcohol dehydrogenase family)